jgi:hypothetical protein
MSSAQSPILTRPTVRVLFEDLELIAYPGHPITIDIYFRNTNRLYVYRDDNYILQEIQFEERYRNKTDEYSTSYTDVIVEPNYTVKYTVIAESEDWERDYADISFQTYSNPD